MRKAITVTVVLSQPETLPPKDGSFTEVRMQANHANSSVCRCIQFDDNYNAWFDAKNQRVAEKNILTWTRVEEVPDPVVPDPVVPEHIKTAEDYRKERSMELNRRFIALELPVAALIDWEPSKDNYGNPVTLLLFPDCSYRMVRFPHTRNSAITNYSIFAGKGQYIPIRIFHSDNDCQEHTCKIGDYSTNWSDGDNLGCSDNFTPEQKEIVRRITNDNDIAFILYVLHLHRDDPEGFWRVKQPKQQAAA